MITTRASQPTIIAPIGQMRQVIETSSHPDLVLLHFARSASDRELHILRQVLHERESGS